MNPDQTAPKSDLGAYCLQYRLPKNISRWMREHPTKVMNGGLKVNNDKSQ